MDILARGATWLADTVIQQISTPVHYCPVDGDPVPINASLGRSMFRVEEDGVTKTVWTDSDFIFRYSDLSKIIRRDPIIGDRINKQIDVDGGSIDQWYLVSAPQGEQPFRKADNRQGLIRVHTKLDSEEEL